MNTYSFKAFPPINTERLVLRQLTATDKTAIFKLRSDDRVNEFLGRPKALSIEEAEKFILKISNLIANNESLYWAIAFNDEPSLLVGTICLWNFSEDKSVAEIGYELMPEYQGKAIMQEAIKAVIDFSFNKIQLRKIEAYTHQQNAKSSALLEKLDFKLSSKRPDESEPHLIIYELTGKN